MPFLLQSPQLVGEADGFGLPMVRGADEAGGDALRERLGAVDGQAPLGAVAHMPMWTSIMGSPEMSSKAASESGSPFSTWACTCAARLGSQAPRAASSKLFTGASRDPECRKCRVAR